MALAGALVSIVQQLTVNEGQGFAQLVIRADAEGIAALAALAEELSEREGITTDGTITYQAPPDPPN